MLRVRVKDSTSKKGVRVNLCCEVNVLRVRALGLGLGLGGSVRVKASRVNLTQ